MRIWMHCLVYDIWSGVFAFTPGIISLLIIPILSTVWSDFNLQIRQSRRTLEQEFGDLETLNLFLTMWPNFRDLIFNKPNVKSAIMIQHAFLLIQIKYSVKDCFCKWGSRLTICNMHTASPCRHSMLSSKQPDFTKILTLCFNKTYFYLTEHGSLWCTTALIS